MLTAGLIHHSPPRPAVNIICGSPFRLVWSGGYSAFIFHFHFLGSALLAGKEMEEEIVCNRETDLTGGRAAVERNC